MAFAAGTTTEALFPACDGKRVQTIQTIQAMDCAARPWLPPGHHRKRGRVTHCERVPKPCHRSHACGGLGHLEDGTDALDPLHGVIEVGRGARKTSRQKHP